MSSNSELIEKGSAPVILRMDRLPVEQFPGDKSTETSALIEATPAVSVRNAYKSYQKGNPVLQGLNMTVPSGAIYSLLGSSGCGKTTLLSCCVGLRNLDKGEIKVFGHSPGTKESGVPGRRIGYMPQELALYSELSIEEVLNFYGRIYGMKREEVEDSLRFLLEFLSLPKASRRVGTLSGGQKRRVSIAVALLHRPQLVILDEPTVGVDPLLRQSIWEHLLELVSGGNTTIIITTHYVEEARQSNFVGIMRNGNLLAEESPEVLLAQYQVTLLEDIVLSLSRQDREDRKQKGEEKIKKSSFRRSLKLQRNSHNSSIIAQKRDEEPEVKSIPKLKNSSQPSPNPVSNTSNLFGRLSALIIKNFKMLIRNLAFLAFVFALPTMQIIFVCLTVGPDPRGLTLGVVSPEACDFEGKDWRNISQSCPISIQNGSLSCFYLSLLPKDTFILRRELSEESALHGVRKGNQYGYIEFPVGYSENILCRFGNKDCSMLNTTAEEILTGSNIIVELDMSNKQVGQIMKRMLTETYGKMIEQIREKCSNSTLSYEGIPFNFNKPIYGTDETTFVEFIAPNTLMALLFFLPLCFTSISYIAEKKIGTLDRALVAGVGPSEFILGFLIFQLVILLGQAGLAFFILTKVYKIQILGNIYLALSLSISIGVCGAAGGFLVAMLCSEEIHAVLLAMGTFFPNMLLSGTIWPLEGMPDSLQFFAYFLPCALPCEAMRSIVSRGWTLEEKRVWLGFVVTFAWTFGCWAIAAVIHRVRSKI